MTVRFGILGAGRILGKLGPAYRAARGVRLVAIASREIARAEAAAREHGAERAYGSYEALLADGDVDVVHNALHNGLHCEWTVRALEAGKHVLCEKPLACSDAEVERMFAVAHARRRVLMEGFMYRFHPQMQEALRRVQAGELGQPLHIRACYATRGREPGNPRYWPEAGGGALMDVGCYCVNASLLFAGCAPQRVTANARFANGVDMTLSGMLDFGGGLTAHILCSFELEGVYRLEVVGTEAKLEIPNPWSPPEGQGEFWVTRGGRAEVFRQAAGRPFASFVAEIEHFAECVRDSSVAPLVTEADSRLTMRVIGQLRQAAQQGFVP
ncbi:MAG: Gfo/Idh/MocA family oxidoreductase [Verrucomicrobiae bacterium]|nr:Gfo/Idh/MocA family oxidoreductase [Verrucomicrobiae bacterium]